MARAFGSRDCTRLVESIHKQVGLVRSALDAVKSPDVPVRGALCFVDDVAGAHRALAGAFPPT